MRPAGSRHNLRSATRERFSGFHPTIAMIVPTGGAGRTVPIWEDEVELAEELATRDGGGVGGAGPADEDDAGRKCVGADSDGSRVPLGSHRPSAGKREPRTMHGFEKRFPPCRRG